MSASSTVPTPSINPGGCSNAWILNDAGGTAALASSLELKHISVSKTISVDSLHSAEAATTVLNEFKASPPEILWVNVPKHVKSWTSKSSKRLAVLIAAMVYFQITEQRQVVLEGCPVSSKGWHAEKFTNILQHPRVNTSQVHWCALGILDQDARPVCHYTRVLSTFSLPASLFLCCKSPSASKLKHFPVNMWTDYYSCLVDMSVLKTYAAVPKKKKPKDRVSFIDDVDGPGEHADSTEVGSSATFSRVKTASDVEDVFDDCGDDLDPLSLVETFTLFDSNSPPSSDDENGFAAMFDSEYYSWALPGSAFCDSEDLSLRPFSSHYESLESVLVVLDESPGIHDVMELFGGEGKVA